MKTKEDTIYLLRAAFRAIMPWKMREDDKNSHHAYFEGWNDCLKEIKKNKVKFIKHIENL